MKLWLYPFVFVLSVLSCAYRYFVYALLDKEDVVVVLFTAEFCGKTISAAGEMPAVAILNEGVFHLFKGVCFFVKHMNGRGREDRLLGSVVHPEHFDVIASLPGDFFHSFEFPGLFGHFHVGSNIGNIRFGTIRGGGFVRFFCFFGRKIKFVGTHFFIFHN